MYDNKEQLLKLHNTTSSAAFRRLLTESAIKNAIMPLLGDSIPISEIGLDKKAELHLSKNGIDTVSKLLAGFPDNLAVFAVRKSTEYNLILSQLEMYLRDIISIIVSMDQTDNNDTADSMINESRSPDYETPPFDNKPFSDLPFSDNKKKTAPDVIAKIDFFNRADFDQLKEYYQKHNIPVDELGLSVRSYNSLRRAGLDTVYAILSTGKSNFLNIHNLGKKSIEEIYMKINSLFDNIYTRREVKPPLNDENINNDIIQPMKEDDLSEMSGADLFTHQYYKKRIIEWFEAKKISLSSSSLSTRSRNALAQVGVYTVAQLLNYDRKELNNIRNIGTNSVFEINSFIENVLEEYRNKYIRYIIHNEKDIALEQSEICSIIMKMYDEPSFSFYGFSFKEYRETIPETVSDEEIKRAVSLLLNDGKLEYVDFRCYKIHQTFKSFLDNKAEHDIHYALLKKHINGKTIRELTEEEKVTKQRISQILERTKKSFKRIDKDIVFDDDYYKYLYEHYDLPREVWLNNIQCSESTLAYLKFFADKGRDTDIDNAIADPNVTVNIKYRLQKYLDSQKIVIDGIKMEPDRSTIENYILKTYCCDEIKFSDYVKLYNDRLISAGVSPDNKLYIDEEKERTVQNKISRKRNVLWKFGSRLRYYEINSYDYSELLETINLAQYKNVELSTFKWFSDYPETMRKYDIRDQYELHSLLKKIVDTSDYDNDIQFKKQPTVCFGEFDRDKAIMEIITAFSPVEADELAEYISSEYGYAKSVILAGYLTPFKMYYHNGVYSIDFKRLPPENKDIFVKALTEDYYGIDDLRSIYSEIFPDDDTEAVNPRTLKEIGFDVYNGYVIRNFRSSEEFFRYILTKDDITDIKTIKQKYSAAYTTLSLIIKKLCDEKEIFYFDSNTTINFRRLAKLGVTKEQLDDYCTNAISFINSNEFFTIRSLRSEGFKHTLDQLGLDDYFYGMLLANDSRLSWSKMYGEIVLYNNNSKKITRKDFIASLIIGQIRISIDRVIKMGKEKYGVTINDKYHISNAAQECGMYFDYTMERIYKDKSYYYEDLEKTEMED